MNTRLFNVEYVTALGHRLNTVVDQANVKDTLVQINRGGDRVVSVKEISDSIAA